MTNNQKEAFSRIQASVTRYQYVEAESGTYRTDDLVTILEYVDTQTAKLESVKEDLIDLRGLTEEPYTWDMTNSILAFLEAE